MKGSVVTAIALRKAGLPQNVINRTFTFTVDQDGTTANKDIITALITGVVVAGDRLTLLTNLNGLYGNNSCRLCYRQGKDWILFDSKFSLNFHGNLEIW
ncbi:MAG: hypothetical protein WCT19_02765 [Candidatus Paceibacterota bacterium]|jgi:hypothetical protein